MHLEMHLYKKNLKDMIVGFKMKTTCQWEAPVAHPESEVLICGMKHKKLGL